MPLSTDVNLPKSHPPHFPDRCVLCREHSPDSTFRLVTGTIGWWTWLLWMFGKPYMVKAPACTRCSWILHLQRLSSIFTTCFLLWIAFWYLWPMVEHLVSPGWRRLAMMGLGLVCIAPQLFYEVCYPKALGITAYSNSVDFEFRDEGTAFEFAGQNFDAKWVKVNGVNLKPES
jgi:hypothetical protein